MLKQSSGKMDVKSVVPKRRPPESHKGDFGRLLVIGGGSRYVGAPALVGMAALRSGADLAIIAATERAAGIINSFSPDLITIQLPGRDLEPAALSEIWSELKRSTAVVVGPGLGTQPLTRDAVIALARTLREKYPKLPALFDANGLKVLAAGPDLAKGMPWVMTPHAGEFKILTGTELDSNLQKRAEQVRQAAQELGCTILLTGNVDIIASTTGELKLNRTGNPGMTVGGTGDVLAGVVGALLSQGVEPFKAAVAGAWIAGRAGDLCFKERGYEFIASDLLDKLPAVFKEVRGQR
jgi:NAD(P)H-hydrate epimerase